MSFCKLDEDIPERLHFFSKIYFPYPKELITVCERIIGDRSKDAVCSYFQAIFQLPAFC